MEGSADPKRMARSKRAASQRSKAKHQQHRKSGRQAASDAPDAAANDEKDASSLPSNWERYEDESAAEATLASVGEVRYKSTGADYSELLSSSKPELFEEPPEPEGMMAMLLSSGLGLYDWDSSYLEPASSTAEQQAALEVAEVLALDMRQLGKSLSRINVAERLFLEDELFPEQDHVEEKMEATDGTTMVKSIDSPSTPNEDLTLGYGGHLEGCGDTFKTGLDLGKSCSRADSIGADVFHTSSVDLPGDSRSGIISFERAESSGFHSNRPDSPLLNAEESIAVPSPRIDTRENIPSAEMKGLALESPTNLFTGDKFQAAAAEAELDDLLNLLDNHGSGISLNKCNLDVVKEKSPASNFATPSHPVAEEGNGLERRDVWVGPNFEEPDPTRKGAFLQAGDSFVSRKEENVAPEMKSAAAAPLVPDDDFDSWLDSI